MITFFGGIGWLVVVGYFMVGSGLFSLILCSRNCPKLVALNLSDETKVGPLEFLLVRGFSL